MRPLALRPWASGTLDPQLAASALEDAAGAVSDIFVILVFRRFAVWNSEHFASSTAGTRLFL